MTSGPAVGGPVAGNATGLGAGFRALMSSWVTGVAVVTAIDADGQPRGMTCSSLCSVALDPPTLLVCLRTGSITLDAVITSGEFAVNLLHEHAQQTAELFASGAPDRFDRTPWHHEPARSGPQLITAAHTTADCLLTKVAPVGDHTVVFGQVHDIHQEPEGKPVTPLLYGLRQYSRWPTRNEKQSI